MATVKEEYKLYENHEEPVLLEYLPNSHTYKIDGDRKIGVTTITGIINKEALMLYPLAEAINYMKQNLLIGEEDQATTWTTKELQECIEKANNAWRAKNLRGTDAGTIGHDWLERYLRAVKEGTELPKPMERVDLSQFGPNPDKTKDEYIRATDMNNIISAIEEFTEWFEENDVEIVEVERIIYSKQYDYAGRFDALLRINGQLIMIDFKTSNPSRDFAHGIYPENFSQLGGYDIAYTEEFPEVKIDGHGVINLSKKSGKMQVKIIAGEEERKKSRDFFLATLLVKRGMQNYTRILTTKFGNKK